MEDVETLSQKGLIPIVAEPKKEDTHSTRNSRLFGVIVAGVLLVATVATCVLFTIYIKNSPTASSFQKYILCVKEGDGVANEHIEISVKENLEIVRTKPDPQKNQKEMTLLHDYNLRKTAIRFANENSCYIRAMKPQTTGVNLEEIEGRFQSTQGEPQTVSAVYSEYFVPVDDVVGDSSLSVAIKEFCDNRKIQLLARIPKENATAQDDTVKSRERRQLLGFPPMGLPHPPPHGPVPPFGHPNAFGPPRPFHPPPPRGHFPMHNPYGPPLPGMFPGFHHPPPGHHPYGPHPPFGPHGPPPVPKEQVKPAGKGGKKDKKGILPPKDPYVPDIPKKKKGGKGKDVPFVPLDPGPVVGIGPVDPYVPLPPKDPILKPGKKGKGGKRGKKNKKNKNKNKKGGKKCFKQKACKLKEGCEVKTEKYCARYDLGHRGPWGFHFGIPQYSSNPTCIKWDFREIKDCVNVKDCEKICT